MNELMVTLIGRKSVLIENYSSILDYDDSGIDIQGKKEKLHISGNRLSILYYDEEEMLVNGVLKSIEYRE